MLKLLLSYICLNIYESNDAAAIIINEESRKIIEDGKIHNLIEA